MEVAELKAEQRAGTGKGVAHRLRAAGKMPAILYGNGTEPMQLAIDKREFAALIRGESGSSLVVKLMIGGDSSRPTALIKDLQLDQVRGSLLHVDFQRVLMDQTIATTLPIAAVGEAPGVKFGGVLEHQLTEVDVEGTPAEMPAQLEADISGLEIGDSFNVRDLSVPSGVDIITDPDQVVFSIVPPKTEAPAVESVEEFEAGESDLFKKTEEAA